MPKAATVAKDLSEKDTSRTAIQHTIPVIAGITGAVTEAVFLKIATTFFIITFLIEIKVVQEPARQDQVTVEEFPELV